MSISVVVVDLPSQPTVREVREILQKYVDVRIKCLRRDVATVNDEKVYRVDVHWFSDSNGRIFHLREVENWRRILLTNDNDIFPIVFSHQNNIIVEESDTEKQIYVENHCKEEIHAVGDYCKWKPAEGEDQLLKMYEVIAKRYRKSQADIVVRYKHGKFENRRVTAVVESDYVFYVDSDGFIHHSKDVTDIQTETLQKEITFPPGLIPFLVITSADSYRPQNFETKGVLGDGSYGTAYLCWDKDAKFEFVMKEMNTKDKSDARATEREISILSYLKHDNIIQYLGSSWNNDKGRIFLQYMPGKSLGDFIPEDGFEEEDTAKHTHQILKGLHYLHQKGVLHRDINPDNILYDGKSVLKLADFGISLELKSVNEIQQVSAGKTSAPTASADYYGNLRYMAPEIITVHPRGKFSKAADVWSVGCVIWEMISGCRPWDFLPNIYLIEPYLRQKKRPDQPDDGSFQKEISADLKHVFNEIFKHEPGERSSVDDLLKLRFFSSQNVGLSTFTK